MKKRDILVSIVVGFGVTALSSCSFLGTRQESTKKDLDQNQISQMRVLGSKDEATTSTTSPAAPTSEDASLGENVTSATYEAKFLNPTMNAKDFIKRNNVSLDKMDDDKIFSNGMDRASLFFDLGAQLYSKLSVNDTSDENTKLIPAYSADKTLQLQNDMHCQTPVQSFIVKGAASINLDRTNVGVLMTEKDMEEYAKDDLDLTKIKEFLFSDFSDDLKNLFYESFDPKLNEVKVGIAHQVLYCGQDENSEPKAYLSNSKDYYPITKDNIHISNGDITLTFSKVVPKDDLAGLQLINNNEVPTLDKISYGNGRKKIGVFNGTNYKKIINLTFSLKPVQSGSTPSDALPAIPPTNVQPTNSTPQPEKILQPIKVDYTPMAIPYVRYSEMPLTQRVFSPTTEVVTDPTDNSKNPAPKKVANPTPKKTDPKSSSSSTKQDDPQNIKKTMDAKANQNQGVLEVFAKKTNPVWFNPKLNGHAKNFYQIEYGYLSNEITYQPGNQNWDFWNDAAFSQTYLSDSQVQARCNDYKYRNDLTLDVSVNRPYEQSFTLSRKDTDGTEYSLSRTYEQFLYDQFRMDTPYDFIAKPMVDASLNISNQMKKQKWDIKVCFDDKKGFTGFWSSLDTQNIYSYNETKGRVIRSSDRAAKWLEITVNKDSVVSGKSLPKGFNQNRKNYPHSLLTITCKNSDPDDCAVEFQFAIKRDLEGSTLVAYMDQNILENVTYPSGLKKVGEMIKKTVDGFDKKKDGTHHTNRNEVVIYGGFKFDPNDMSSQTVQYMTPAELKNNGYTSEKDYVPSVVANFLFPGEDSELYFNVTRVGPNA